MLVTADQLVAHAIGDYVLQSDWMANEKTKKDVAALAHALTYTLCFIPFVWGVPFQNAALALLIIASTHFAIDRWRLARYVCWAKNFLAPRLTTEVVRETVIGPGGKEMFAEKLVLTGRWWHPWADCVGTGYHKERPPWMAVWLMIIADNTMHVLCNAIALRVLS